MAGLLPGVEVARRRRFHHTNLNRIPSPPIGTRRSTYCLYAISSYVFHSNSMRKQPWSDQQQQGLTDDGRSGLCAAAREAKKRLDDRLQPQRRSQPKRLESRAALNDNNPQRSLSRISLISNAPHSDQLPPNSKKKKKWLKLMSWKSSEQEECAICLEQLNGRASSAAALMQVPCGHRFHRKCLMPWLQGNVHNNPHCPCCRMEIILPAT